MEGGEGEIHLQHFFPLAHQIPTTNERGCGPLCRSHSSGSSVLSIPFNWLRIIFALCIKITAPRGTKKLQPSLQIHLWKKKKKNRFFLFENTRLLMCSWLHKNRVFARMFIWLFLNEQIWQQFFYWVFVCEITINMKETSAMGLKRLLLLNHLSKTLLSSRLFSAALCLSPNYIYSIKRPEIEKPIMKRLNRRWQSTAINSVPVFV